MNFLNNLIQRLTEFNKTINQNCIFSFTKTNNETLKITIEWEKNKQIYKKDYLIIINYLNDQYENNIFDQLKNEIIQYHIPQ
jgi:hypothetical protein